MQIASLDVDTEINIGATSTTIAENDFAKLSYYLNCVAYCIPGVIEKRFTDYSNYLYFSDETKGNIVALAAILSPSLLEGKVVFLTTDAKMEALRPGGSNTFVTAKQKQNLTMVNVDNQGVVGLNLNSTDIVSIMIYKQLWMNYYYITPMRNIANGLGFGQKAQAARPNYNVRYNPEDYANNPAPFFDGCSGYIIVFLLAFFLNILGFCCGMGIKRLKNRNWACLFGFLGLALNVYVFIFVIYGGFSSKKDDNEDDDYN